MPPTWTSGEASSDSESVDSGDLCPLGTGVLFYAVKKAEPGNGPASLLGWKKTKLFIRRYAHLCRRCEPAPAEQPPGFPLGREIPISGRDWERITGTPWPPNSGFLRCLRRDRLRFSTGKKGWFPVPQRHPASRTRRVTGWFPGFGRWTQPVCQPCGSGHCPPHSGKPKVFDNPGEDRNTIPTRQGKPGI